MKPPLKRLATAKQRKTGISGNASNRRMRALRPAGTGKIPPKTQSATALYLYLYTYIDTLVHMNNDPRLEIERVQTGVRMEKRILKVLKAFAEYHDMTLGDVLEGIVLHAFDGKTPFSPASLEKIRELKRFYELDLDSSASHRLREIKARSGRKRKEGGA